MMNLLFPRVELATADIDMDWNPGQHSGEAAVSWRFAASDVSRRPDYRIALACYHYARVITCVEERFAQPLSAHVAALASLLASGAPLGDALSSETPKLVLTFGPAPSVQVDPWFLTDDRTSLTKPSRYVARLEQRRATDRFWYSFELGVTNSKVLIPACLFLLIRDSAAILEGSNRDRLGAGLAAMCREYATRDESGLRRIRGQKRVAELGCLVAGVA